MIYAIRGDMTNAGFSVAAILPIGGQAATAARLFRTRVLEHLGVDATQAAGKHAHHILPKKFAFAFWERFGLDVNDPRFGALLDGSGHMQLHNVFRYNTEWEEWFANNQNATAEDALRFARELASKYGFTFNP